MGGQWTETTKALRVEPYSLAWHVQASRETCIVEIRSKSIYPVLAPQNVVDRTSASGRVTF